MAISTTDVTITTTWTQLSSADSGDFILSNEAQPTEHYPAIGSTASEAIRYAFDSSTPTVRGHILMPGCSLARGSVVGHVWAKVDGAGTVPAQVAE